MNRRALGRRRTLAALLVVTAVALLARLFALGARVFHWDEGRVAYWTLRAMESGIWEYRAIVHGPFLFHVNGTLFGVFGTSDFIARLVVALVGGFLPLTAWLFRERLEDIEIVLLGGFLALNPVLLYYSRFMRNDVLVAAFALVTIGFFVRLLDTGKHGYLYAGVFSLGLAFTAKEIVVVYLAVWVGAVALLLDHRLFVASVRERQWQGVAMEYLRRLYRGVRRYRLPILVAVMEFLLIIVVFYAPRPDLYQALGDPTRLLGVLDAATLGNWEKLKDLWISGSKDHSYIAFLSDALLTTAYTSLPLTGLAILGFVVDRYAGAEPRDIVAFGAYWGGTIFFIYPAITDISAPWSLVHAMVPLAIPAAVGLRLIVDRGIEAHESEDMIGVGLAVLVVLAVVAQVGITAIETSYRSPQSDGNPLVQYGQPAGDMQPRFADIDAIAVQNEGTDVLFYGDHFYLGNESAKDQYPPAGNWLNRMPLPWYLERNGATVDSTKSLGAVDGEAPIVIARADQYDDLEPRLQGYDSYTYKLTLSNTETVFFVKRSALEAADE